MNVIICAYKDIISSKNEFDTIPTEDQRRNQIVKKINENRKKYSYDLIITTEAGTYDDDYNTIGRIDICICYISQDYTQKYLSFECKRFCNKNSYSQKSIYDPFHNDGILRYIDKKYECQTGYGGMIAFCESGSFCDLNREIQILLESTSKSNKSLFNDLKFEYIYESLYDTIKDEEISIISILMDFTMFSI